jgi:peroxiredoxin
MRARHRALGAFTLALTAAFVLAAPSGLTRRVLAQDEEGEGGGDQEEIVKLSSEGIEALRAKKYDEGIAAYKKVLAAADKLGSEEAKKEWQRNAHYNIACAYSLKKEPKEALDHLDQSVQLGFWGWRKFEADHDLDNIRGEARYKEIVDKGHELAAKRAKELKGKLLKDSAIFDYELSIKPVNRDAKLKSAELLGKVVVVDFFQNEEDKGIEETADFATLWKENKDKGLEVVGLLYVPSGEGPLEGDEAKEQAKACIESHKLPYAVGVASGKQIERARVFSRGFQSATFVIDRAGKLRAVLGGQLRQQEMIQEIVSTLLAEKAPEKKGEEKKDDQKKDEDKGEKKDKDKPI